MNFDLTEEQRLLADSVRRFVEKDYAFEARKKIVASDAGYSPQAWSTLAELGLLALPVPAEYGGFGGSALDLVPAMEAIGEALVVEPYLSTVMCARMLSRSPEAGNPGVAEKLLPAVAEGALKLAFAHTEDGSRYDLDHVTVTARRDGDHFVLDGVKRAVLHAPQAELLLVSARVSRGAGTAGISLFVVEPQAAGVTMQPYRTIDELRGADVRLAGVRVAADACIGREGNAFDVIEEGVDFATALLCAEAVGAMRYANEATLEYLKTRKQFGVPIGSFQALQHRMVDMVIEAEQSRSMASLACAAMARPDARERRRMVSAAKIRVSEACTRVSQEAVQLHGGMGMTEELKVSHTFRRLTTLAWLHGDVDHHLQRFARAS